MFSTLKFSHFPNLPHMPPNGNLYIQKNYFFIYAHIYLILYVDIISCVLQLIIFQQNRNTAHTQTSIYFLLVLQSLPSRFNIVHENESEEYENMFVEALLLFLKSKSLELATELETHILMPTCCVFLCFAIALSTIKNFKAHL